MTVEIINDAICDRPEILWDDLGLEGEIYNEHYSSNCIIHDGDKKDALNVYFNQYGSVRGRWVCATRGCHKTFRNSVIGFCRGVLSSRHCGWSKPGDEIYGWSDTLKYIKQLYGIDGSTKAQSINSEKKKFNNAFGGYNQTKEKKIICTKEKYLWYYSSPPQYFRERGFSSETLEKYNVRYCDSPNSKLYRRCCVPVFDGEARNVIGISARTTCDEEPKWRNTTNFPASTSLYNYEFASEYIKRSRTAIIVEGPADIWKLYEAGIYNAVGIWGTELNDYKKFLLDKLGVMKLVLALDNDKAGRDAIEKIKRETGRIYNTVEIALPSEFNDIGETPIDIIKNIFKGGF